MVFIDGNNWYHSLREAGITGTGQLNYAKVSEKLAGPGREWVGTRYYIGRVNQGQAPQLYADQRKFLAFLTATDHRITHYLGRLETRRQPNEAAIELRQYLSGLKTRIDTRVFQDLMNVAKRNVLVDVMSEKAVDVMLAVDMVLMAERNEYDAAYLLTADGDFTPAVAAVRSLDKPVYAASPATGAQLAAAVTKFIPLSHGWFADCW
jgi:uncharacterized LabA/DUF88 family protein